MTEIIIPVLLSFLLTFLFEKSFYNEQVNVIYLKYNLINHGHKIGKYIAQSPFFSSYLSIREII